jgi:hypothetical protein
MWNKSKAKIGKTTFSERGEPNSYVVASIVIRVQGS